MSSAIPSSDQSNRLNPQHIIGQLQVLIPVSLDGQEDANLIQLGLDSLHIMRLVNQWRKAGARVTFAQLIERPILSHWLSLLVTDNQDAAQQESADDFQALLQKTRDDQNLQDRCYSDQPFNLTDVQYAYWMGRQDNQELGGNGCHAYLEIDGDQVLGSRLEMAWHQLIRQHSMLRARFTDEGQQFIPDDYGLPELICHDFSELSAEQAEQQAQLIRSRLSHRKLAIESGQVMGLELSLLPGGKTRIHFDVDLLVADVQSLHILLRDLAEAYNTLNDQPESAATLSADPDWRFAHYLAIESERKKNQSEADKTYWQQRLSDLPSGPQLPLAKDPHSIGKPEFIRRTHLLSTEKWQSLKSIAASYKVTPAMVLASAYAEVLARWSASPEFLLNIPLFDRQTDHPGIEDVVADFTNLLLLQCNCRDALPFLNRTRQIQKQLYKDIAHASYSAVSIQRDLARQGLTDGVSAPVVFACNLGTPLLTDTCRNTLGELNYMISQTPQVWLDHQLYEMEDGLLLAWDAVDELFPHNLISDMFAAYTQLLEWLAEDKGHWLQHSPDLMPEYQNISRQQANNTLTSYHPHLLHQAMFDTALQTPERAALIVADQIISYGQLADQALRIARLLQQQGLKTNDPVAITLPRGVDQIAAVFGVLAAGGCYVPIGVHQPASRQARIHQTAGINLVLTSSQYLPEAGQDDVRYLDISQAESLTPLTSPVPVAAESSAYIIFTSGSTGEPKGVEMAHRATANTIDNINRRYNVHQNSRALAVSALDFDLSVYDIFGLLSTGGALVLLRDDQRRDAAVWLDLVQQHKVTVWNSVPVLLDMLLIVAENQTTAHPASSEAGLSSDTGLSFTPGLSSESGLSFEPQLSFEPSLPFEPQLSFEQVMLSGDWIGLDLPSRLFARTSEHTRLIAMGGATEAAIWSNAFDAFEPDQPLPAHWTSIPYGKPLANQHYRVVDAQGRDCPDWVAGELWIGGIGVAEGYRGDTDMTVSRFVMAETNTVLNPAVFRGDIFDTTVPSRTSEAQASASTQTSRWYRTGDQGRYWPDGHLEFLGRLDHQVKVRGHRIELGEIETALLSLPEISRAVAVTITSEGQPPSLAAAVIVDAAVIDEGSATEPSQNSNAALDHSTSLDKSATLDSHEITAALHQLLPDYMVPSTLVAVSDIPLSANGKVDRKQVTALLADQINTQPIQLTAPETDNEKAVATLWQALLDTDQIGRESNFFSLGGDSLLATQVIARLRQQGLSAEQPLRLLFAKPELQAFAAELYQTEQTVQQQVVAEPEQRFEPFLLTEVQRAYWMGQSPGLPLSCGTHYLTELDGADVDLTRLEQAWNKLVHNHEMMRAFVNAEGQQQILAEVPDTTIQQYYIQDLSLQIDVADPAHPDNAEGTTAATDTSRTDSLKQMIVLENSAQGAQQWLHHCWHELSRQQQNSDAPVSEGWTPCQINAVHYTGTQGESRCRIGITFDYLTLDGFSIKLLLEQLADLYHDPDSSVHTPGLSFRDYVNQVDHSESEKEQAVRFWQDKITTLPLAPELPLATEPDTLTAPEFNRREARLSADQWTALKEKARQHQITPSVLLLVAYSQIIRQWSGGNDHTLNLTLFDRQDVHADINRVLGDFTSLAPVGFYAEHGNNLLAQARATQQEIAQALEHKSISSIWVQRERSHEMSLTSAALPVVFTSTLGLGNGLFENPPAGFPDLVAGGLSETPQVWLDHQLYEYKGELALSWDSVDALFPEQMLDQMFEAYLDLLQALVQQDWSEDFKLTLPEQQLRVRQQVNQTHTPYQPHLLHQAMFTTAQQAPERTALIASDHSVSYGQLADQALRIAQLLKQQGLQTGDPVAITLPRGTDQIAAVFGVLAAGGCYVPIGVHQPVSRQARIHQTAGIKLVLTSVQFLPENSVRDEASDNGSTRYLDMAQAESLTPLSAPVDVAPEASAYIIFTSGSTGEPKGVEMAHRATANTIDNINQRYGVHQDSRALAVSALDFDLSVYDIFGLLSTGGALVVLEEEQRRDAAIWLDLVQQHQITVWNSVPVLLDMLLVVAENQASATLLPFEPRLSFEQVMLSGDWIGLDLPSRLFAQTSHQTRLIAMGGATEAAIWSNSFDAFEPGQPLPPHWTSVPYGKPLENQHYRVVDAQGRDCPDWVAGELWIGGIGVAEGYRGDSQQTAARFVLAETDTIPQPVTFASAENAESVQNGATNTSRWYRTGDQGRYWPDGHLEFLGRLDHQVKVRGHRIELGEIETALLTLPEISRAVAVTVKPDGQQPSLAAAVTTEENAQILDTDGIRSALQQLLPDYMVPTTLVSISEIPLSANGKVDRKQVTALLAEQVSAQPQQLTSPATDNERVVAALWQELLDTDQIGRESNFFALGGDSLLATQVIARLRQQGLSAEQPLRLLFANPELQTFAAELNQTSQAAMQQDVIAQPEQRFEPFPLTEVQRAYWMGQSPGLPLNCGTHYLVELDGEAVDLQKLEQACNTLIQRHEMLRVKITPQGEQQILPADAVESIQVDSDHTVYADQDNARAQLDSWWQYWSENNRITQQNDNEQTTLFAIKAVHYGQNRCRLGLLFNYMTLDGFSIKLLLDELAELYQNPDVELPAFDLSFRDYVNQVKPDPQALAQAEDYWYNKLENLPMAAALPLARDPRTLQDTRFSRREARINRDNWAQLRQSARDQGITPSVLILTAYGEILSQWNGGKAHTINLTLFDRQPVHPDINRIVGDFTSLAPVAYHPDNQKNLLQLSQQVQDEIASALEHREISSIWVQRERAREMDLVAAALPIVFTSTLGMADGLLEEKSVAGFPDLAGGGLSETPQVWLDHQMYEHQGELMISWDSVDALFPDGLIDSMFGQFIQLLNTLAGQWDQPLKTALPEDQCMIRQQVNQTHTPYQPHLLHQAMFATAQQTPERTALIASDQSISYGQLADQALRIAQLLKQQGLQSGDPVAITLPRGTDQIAAVFGVLAAGGCYVPIGVHQPDSRQARIHQTAGIKLVLTSAQFLPENPASDEAEDRVVRYLDMAQAESLTPLSAPVDVAPEASAYIIFTSGSTGEPKGVEMAHRATANTIDNINQRYGVHQESRALAVSALDFDLSVYDIFGLLSTGGALVLLEEEQRRDAAIWLDLVQQHQITVWNSVPVLLDMLLVVAENQASATLLPFQPRLSFEQVMLSGDWIGLDLPSRLFAQASHQTRLIAMGGATEAAIWSNSFDAFEPGQPLPPHWTSVPYGKPLENQHYRVVDTQGRDCPDWVAGELWIGGIGVAEGYRGDTDLTASRFVLAETATVQQPAAFASAENAESVQNGATNTSRWYRTGDQGRYWPDGHLEFLGRLDYQVKVRGHRIELGEIETALLTLPEISRAVAVTVKPEGQPPSLAAAVMTEGAESGTEQALDTNAIKTALQQLLPEYMVPATLVAVSEIPLSANGKVDRKQITTLMADQLQGQQAYQAPENELEADVARIWCQVLKRERISRTDDFFLIGGDSLSATQIVQQLHQQRVSPEAVSLITLFTSPTIAALSEQIQQQWQALSQTTDTQDIFEEGLL
ncbi:non-ribosomal peptide synthetase [Oceanospirillum sediminis]|uniref:L-cysteine--[L-cysteinyl-carrier protein] ligase n=1 Tax=Oceanospirillum sediminis TaxID=2760088 RepID=A0A839IM49_9GAMM|nr:non-ribosomal peptide synthetase [Oceanospirillum sediminis]MBB1485774.1 amino acid adenylation domain-containing protein [Oceanospirillum sediminis]